MKTANHREFSKEKVMLLNATASLTRMKTANHREFSKEKLMLLNAKASVTRMKTANITRRVYLLRATIRGLSARLNQRVTTIFVAKLDQIVQKLQNGLRLLQLIIKPCHQQAPRQQAPRQQALRQQALRHHQPVHRHSIQ